ncbi:TetR/AcrR family transcriptional regulator [Spiractinospora alimapuensis]|uniref:TetR/AcrR family transcriptional regulator n=1 Tax=Spiractinospora alimapuensis TaxID=2820884 RepID=UPI001F19084E|nr:TetR/AcrR family transcriptional regulator [Spiractinospora alimapuensis]QVQ50283.1 TetR/AcrR family transcriptional regulator [Spiractinospora alimapuensis]
MDGVSEAAEPGRKSRRRGETLHTAILDAALAELTEVGYAELTIERVAERAKASKASVYRRWPSKLHLIYEAAGRTFPHQGEITDTGSLRGDLLAFMRRSAEALQGPIGAAMRGVISDAIRDHSTIEDLRGSEASRTMVVMRDLLDRAAKRGEVDVESVTDRQLEAGHASLRFHFLFHTGYLSDDLVVSIVDEVMLPLIQGTDVRRA